VDVFSEEPPASDLMKALIAQERLVVTPHLGANTQEAQVNVAIDVSKEILAYLDRAPLENAVNLPRFDPAVMDQMRPYFKLMAILSEFGLQLMKGNLDRVTFGFSGAIASHDCSPLTVSGLAALLDRAVDQPVNMVNASLVAERMASWWRSTRPPRAEPSPTDHSDAGGRLGHQVVSGTLFEGTPRIVGLRDYAMDFLPEPHMLLLSYMDRPGMIGKIGTVLGQHEINIAFMSLAGG